MANRNFFKQLKQNFPLKYFLGDNVNAIEIQIWAAMLANLLISLVKSKIKHNWAFSNMVSIIRQQLMDYINIYRFLEDPKKAWRSIINENDVNYPVPRAQGVVQIKTASLFLFFFSVFYFSRFARSQFSPASRTQGFNADL